MSILNPMNSTITRNNRKQLNTIYMYRHYFSSKIAIAAINHIEIFFTTTHLQYKLIKAINTL